MDKEEEELHEEDDEEQEAIDYSDIISEPEENNEEEAEEEENKKEEKSISLSKSFFRVEDWITSIKKHHTLSPLSPSLVSLEQEEYLPLNKEVVKKT